MTISTERHSDQFELGLHTFGDVTKTLDGEQDVPQPQVLRNVLAEAKMADASGVDVIGIGEHHRPDYAISAPDVVLSAIGAATERIKLTSAVTVLSSDDPVRVYQRFATIDGLTGGRAEVSLGRGSFIESYPLFGAQLEDYDDLYDEKVVLLLALDDAGARDAAITWQGRFRPDLTDAVVLPRPADVSGRGRHLNVAVATGGNPQSSVRAARLGLPINYAIIGGRPAQFAPLADLYRREFRAREAFPTAQPAVTLSGFGFVGEDSSSARETFYPYWLRSMTAISRERGFAAPNRITFDATSAPDGAYAVGSPQEVAAKIVRTHRAVGHTRQIFQMDVAGVPQVEQLRAIERLGTQVRPLVEEALAQPAE